MFCFGFIVKDSLLCSNMSHEHSLVSGHANGGHKFAGDNPYPQLPTYSHL